MGQATHVTNWTTKSASALSRRGLKYVIEPATIYPGDPVTISIYDFSEYGLESPYQGLSGKTIGLTNDAKTETVSLSGSQDVHSEFPIHAVENILCQFEIVDEASRALIYPRGADLSGSVGVVAGDLKLNFGASIKPHGTIKLLYDTVKAQIWHHEAFSDAGNAVLFALKSGAIDYEQIPITISERSSNATSGAAIEIVAGTLKSRYFGLDSVISGNPYAVFLVLNATNPNIAVDIGEVLEKGEANHYVYGEKIDLDGSGVINTKYKPKSLIAYTGIFTNKDGSQASATVVFSGNKLSVTKNIFGAVVVAYVTTGIEYYYFSNIEFFPGGGYDQTIGTILATENKASASYVIPAHTAADGNTDEITVLEVSYEVVRSNRGVHELPPAYSSNPPVMTYPGYSFTVDQLLERYNQNPVDKIVVEYAKTIGSSVIIHTEANQSQFPFSVSQFVIWADRKYSLKKTMPENASDSLISAINNAEILLRSKYPGMV